MKTVIRWSADDGRIQEFEAVALVHLDALYRFALRLTHNRADAEDLVQEACLRAFCSFHRFNPGTNCRAWLFTILRHSFLNRLGRARRERPERDAEVWESGPDGVLGQARAADNPEEEFFQTVLHGDVDRALKTLPAGFREAVILVDLEGLSYREVSDVLGCPIGTVMSRLSRGRSLLRQALGRYARERGYIGEKP